jgi:TP901 family phage tail tape measure protein
VALKINITAQISNLEQLRKQIQNNLQKIKISLDATDKLNNQQTKRNTTYTKDEKQILAETNKALGDLHKQYQNEFIDKEKFVKATNEEIQALREQGFSIKKVITDYAGIKTAHKEMLNISRDTINQLKLEAKLRQETSNINRSSVNSSITTTQEQKQALLGVDKELKDLNAQYKTKQITDKEFVQQTVNKINVLKAEGFTIKQLVTEYTGIRNAYIQVLNIQKKLQESSKQTKSGTGSTATTEAGKYNAANLASNVQVLNKINELFTRNIITADQYLVSVKRITTGTGELGATNEKLANQIKVLSTIAAFKNSSISASEYKTQIMELIKDKNILLSLDSKTMTAVRSTLNTTEEIKLLYEKKKALKENADQLLRNQVAERKPIESGNKTTIYDLKRTTEYLKIASNEYKAGRMSAEKYMQITSQIGKNSVIMGNLDAKVLTQMNSNRLKIENANKKAADSQNKVTDSIKKTSATANTNQSAVGKYAANLAMIFKKFADWFIVGNIFMMPIQGIKQALDFVFQMDDALTELSKVTNMTAGQLEVMKNKAIDMGKELAVSSVEIMKSMAEFGRVNKSGDDIAKLAEYSAMASKITTMSAQDAAKAFNTTMILYKKDVGDVGHILDSLNEIQNNFRTSAEDMADGIDKVGAAAQQTGVDMENLEGYITAIVSSTGLSGNESGTAIKSIISRVYRIGEEGIGTDGKAMEALKKIGVNVTQVNGEFRDFDTVLGELNEKWVDMTVAEKQNIAQAVAGTYHYSKFISLMNNFDIATKATSTALNSSGSSISEYNKYLDSASGKWQKLKSVVESKYNNAIDSSLLKGSIDVLRELIDTFGDLETIVVAVAAAFLLWKSAAISAVVVEGITRLTTAITFATTELGLMNGVLAVSKVSAGMFAGSLKALFLTMASNPIAILVASLTALYFINKMSEKSDRDLKNARIDNINHLIKENNTVTNLMKTYQNNYKLVDKNATAKNELIKTQRELISIYGEEAKGLDLVNGKYEDNIKKLNKLNFNKAKNDSISIANELNTLQSENKGLPLLTKKTIGDRANYFTNEYEIAQKKSLYVEKPLTTNPKYPEKNYIKNLNVDLKDYVAILQMMNDKLNESNKSEYKYKDLITGKYKDLIKNAQIYDDVAVNKSNKVTAVKAINTEIDKATKDIEKLQKLKEDALTTIDSAIEGNSKLNEVQSKLYNIAKAKIPTETTKDFKAYADNLSKLMDKIKTPKFGNMYREFNSLNNQLSKGKISYEEYNTAMAKFRTEAGKLEITSKELKNSKLFQNEDIAAPTVRSTEELDKALTQANQDLDDYKSNLKLVGEAYGTLLAGQDMDADKKMELMKLYPQLSEQIKNSVKDPETLMSSLDRLYKSQADSAKDTYETMIYLDGDFYKKLLDNNTTFFDDLNKNYGIDITNYTNYMNLKESVGSDLFKIVGKDWDKNLDSTLDILQKKLDKLTNNPVSFSNEKGFNKWNSDLNNTKEAIGEAIALKKLQDDIKKGTENVDFSDMGADVFAAAVKKAEDASTNLINNLKDLGEAIATLRGGDKLTTETLMKLLKMYPQLSSSMGDQANLLKNLEKLHGNEAVAAKIAYSEMLYTNDDFFKKISKNNEEYWTNLGKQYGVDLKNYSNYIQAKADMNDLLTNTSGKKWEENLGGTVEDLQKRYDALNQPNVPDSADIIRKQIAEALAKAKQLKSIKDAADKIANSFDFKTLGIDKNVNKNEDTEQAEVKTDRYRKLNAALAETNSLLEKNKSLQKGKEGKELNALLDEEVKLLGRKKGNLSAIADEYRKEREETKTKLINSGKGFQFSGTGDNAKLINSESILKGMANQLNAHRKDKDQTYYKSIEKEYNRLNELAQTFFDIQFTNIPQLKQDFTDIGSELYDISELRIDDAIKQLEKKYKEMDERIAIKDTAITKNSNQLSLLDDKDYAGKAANYKQSLTLLSDKTTELKNDIAQLNAVHSSSTRVMDSVKDKLKDLKSQLDDSTYAVKQQEKAWKDYQKTTAQENIGKYVDWLKKMSEDYIDSLNEEMDTRERGYKNFKDNIEDQIKKLQEEADATDLVIEKEKKLAEIRKQQAIIANLKKEKTSKVYKAGEGWIWTVDLSKINDEQNKLKDLTTDYQDWEKKTTNDAKVKALQKQLDDEEKSFNTYKDGLSDKIKELQKTMKKLDDIVNKDNYIKSWNELMSSLKGIDPSFYSTELAGITSFFGSLNTTLSTTQLDVTPIQNQLLSMIPPEIRDLMSKTITTNAETAKKTENLTTPANTTKIATMQTNSNAWWTSDATNKKKLEDENYYLGTSMGLTRKNGVWYDSSGKQVYDVQKYAGLGTENVKAAPTAVNVSAAEQRIINEMKSNSERWLTASDAEKTELSLENDLLVKNSNLPYVKKNGVWYRSDTGTRVYSQGGEVGYTGMAWLDGSKTQPERVLSAAQTESFNKLVGYLPKLNLEKSTTTNQESEIFNISNINVTTNDANDFIGNLKKIIYKRGS